MDLKQYIKVTAPDGVVPVVLMATTRDFFQARGFKIEEPTEEDVLRHFPELRSEQVTLDQHEDSEDPAEAQCEHDLPQEEEKAAAKSVRGGRKNKH